MLCVIAMRNLRWCESLEWGGGGQKFLGFFCSFCLIACLFLVFNFFLRYFFKISTYKVEGEAFHFQIYQAVNRHLRWHRCRLFCYQYLGCHSVHFDSFFIVLLNQFSWDCFKLLKNVNLQICDPVSTKPLLSSSLNIMYYQS